MLIYQIFVLLFCCALSNTAFTESTIWLTPSNNELPLGSSTSVFPYFFQSPIYFPPANQVVQVWVDPSGPQFYYATYDGTSWSTPANNAIPLGTSGGISYVTNPIYDPNSQTLVFIWQSTPQGPYYYAVYDGTGWTFPTANPLPLGSAPNGGLSSNNPIATDSFMFIWESNQHAPLYYATYDGTSWTAATNNEIPLGTSTGIRLFYSPCYNSVTNQVVQVWENYPNTGLLFYSVFDGTSWTPGSQIPLGSSAGVNDGNFSVPIYDPASNQIVEVWLDLNTNLIYYSIFDGTSWVSPSNNQIPLGSSSGVAGFLIELVYDAATEQVLVIWQDSVNNLLYSAAWDGTNWTANNNKLPLGSSTAIGDPADPIYDNYTEQVVQVWQDSNNSLLYYAAYNNGTWSAPTNNAIPLGLSTVVQIFRDPIFDAASNQLVLIWQDATNNRIYYSTYNLLPPLPPTNFIGKVTQEYFLTQTDRINLLTWTPSPDSSVVSYLLRRNGELIDTVPASGPYMYADHNRNKKIPDTYTLTSQNQQGLQSSPLTWTFP